MFSIDLDCKQDHKDTLIADLYEAGCTGIVELADTPETARLRVFFDDDNRQPELQSRFGGEIAPADLRDWVAFAHEFLKPMEIGSRIFICPEWRDDPTPPGRIRIVVNAGLAFGTGAHETTRLCLEALERHLTAEPPNTEQTRTEYTDTEGTQTEGTQTEGTQTEGTQTEGTNTKGINPETPKTKDPVTEKTNTEGTDTGGINPETPETNVPLTDQTGIETRDTRRKPRLVVLDVGTGSGILAEAATKLGAAKVYATDNDPEAVTVAHENFQKANIEVALSNNPTESYPDSLADLVVANISPAWISDLAPEWLRLLRPNGTAILSGFEAADLPRVTAALQQAGARITGEFAAAEWRMLEIQKGLN